MINLTGVIWIDYVVIVAALLSALAVIWKKGIKPIFRWVAESYRNVRDAVAIGSTLVEIAHEFRPNGGGSLRDAMDRVENQVGEVRTSLTDQLVHSEARDTEVASLRAEQIAHAAVDAASFAEMKGAVSTVQGAVNRLTEIVTVKAEERRPE